MMKNLKFDLLSLNKIITLLLVKIEDWIEIVIKSLPNIMLAALVACLTIFTLRIVQKLANKPLKSISPNLAVYQLFKKLISLIFLSSGFFLSLEILNLEKTVTSILAGAGVLGIALGFAFQEIASNFVSGIFIAFKGPYKLDDIVKIGDYLGTVSTIDMRTTTIRTFQGLEVIIPNKELFTKPFINYTYTPERRIDLTVGVSYSSDLAHVKDIATKALERIEERVPEYEIEFFYQDFADSSINFDIRMWVYYPGNQAYLKARSEMIMNIKKAFDDNNITIPFPIRTVELKKS